MAGPIGRTSAATGVGPVRDGERDGTREGSRTSGRGRDAAGRGGIDANDQVSISPDALRGARGAFDEEGGAGGGSGAGDPAASAGASGFRNVGEALLVARGLANVLRGDAVRAANVHDLVSPARAISLLRA